MRGLSKLDELIKKFPELIGALLSKLAQSEFSADIPEIQEAKNKLMGQLKSITDEIAQLQNKEGERLTEEQVRQLSDLRASTAKWTIK